MTTFLVTYFIAFMAVAFVLRSYMVYRATGINPVVRHAPDSAHMYVGMLFGALILGVTATLAVQAIAETPQAYLLSLPPFHVQQAWVGIALMVAAFLVLALAQMQMGRSWRIGIDAKNKTDLVTHGLFGLSRNPIFLAMQVSLLGLFLCLPNVGTLLVMVVSHIAIQFQVRLEEGHLIKLHGERFEAYCGRTRRWL
jgi:protein-S-isoprenylcysteine O-methyltransferase Ste14